MPPALTKSKLSHTVAHENGIIRSEGDDIMSDEVNNVSEVKNQEIKQEVKQQEVKVQETKTQETKPPEAKTQETKVQETKPEQVKAKHRKFTDLSPTERQSYYKELDNAITTSQKTSSFQNIDLRRISAKYNMPLNSVRHYYLDHGGYKLEDEAKPTNKNVPENVDTPSKVDKQQLKEKGTKVMENVVKETTAPKPVEEDRKQERKAPEPIHTEEERQVVKQEEKGFDIVEFIKKHWIVVLGGAIAAVVIIFLIMQLKKSQTPVQTAQSIPSQPQNVQTKPSVQSTQPMQEDSGVITIDKLIKEGRI